MFKNIRSESTTNKIGTAVTSIAVGAGIIVGIVKKKGFFGTLAFAVGFGLAGIAVSTAISQLKKD